MNIQMGFFIITSVLQLFLTLIHILISDTGKQKCIFVPQLPAHVPQERLSCLRLPLPCLESAEHSHTRFHVAKCTAEMQTTLKNTALISEIPCCSQE